MGLSRFEKGNKDQLFEQHDKKIKSKNGECVTYAGSVARQEAPQSNKDRLVPVPCDELGGKEWKIKCSSRRVRDELDGENNKK